MNRQLCALIQDILDSTDRTFRAAYGVGEHHEYLTVGLSDLVLLNDNRRALGALWAMEETHEHGTLTN